MLAGVRIRHSRAVGDRARPPCELICDCGVNPGLGNDAPRRFIRLGNPFVFSRVLQGDLELLAVDASFKGDLFYGGICSLIIGNEPRIDQSPHELYRKLPAPSRKPSGKRYAENPSASVRAPLTVRSYARPQMFLNRPGASAA